MKKVAVAVSGGSDSMAMCFLLKELLGADKILALVVDHGLQDAINCSENTKSVQQELSKHGIVSESLKVIWKEIPELKAKVLEKSREERYSLLVQECLKRDIQLLFVGHTLDDSVVTSLFRIARMSAIEGISGMRQLSPHPLNIRDASNVMICRPLLSVPKSRLIENCKEMGIKVFQDESNYDLSFLRNSCLDALTKIQERNPDVSTERLSNFIEHFKEYRIDAQKQIAIFMKNSVVIDEKNGTAVLVLNDPKFISNKYLLGRVICYLSQFAGNAPFPPKTSNVEDTVNEIQKSFKLQQQKDHRRRQMIKARYQLPFDEGYIKKIDFPIHVYNHSIFYPLGSHDTISKFKTKAFDGIKKGSCLLIQRTAPNRKERVAVNLKVNSNEPFVWDNRFVLSFCDPLERSHEIKVEYASLDSVKLLEESLRKTRRTDLLRKLYLFASSTPGTMMHAIPFVSISDEYFSFPTLGISSDASLEWQTDYLGATVLKSKLQNN